MTLTILHTKDARLNIEYMHFDKFNLPPSGEQFSEQRDSWSTPYKFNDYGGESFNKAFDEHTARSAELDAETGLYYYGARYHAYRQTGYTPEIGIWLSVDPLSDKYPHQSNYMYCSGRLVNVIDPDGMDEWEVNPTGEMVWKKESEKHTVHTIDDKGNRTGKSLTLKNRDIFDQLSSNSKTDKSFSKATGNENSQNDMLKTFSFFADNTDVEWRVDRFDNEGKDNYSIGTLHNSELSPSAERMGHSGSSVISMIHSHPKTDNSTNAEISSMGWWPNKNGTVTIAGDSYLKNSSNMKNANYYTYFPNSGRLWSVRGNKQPAFIRNVKSDYRRLMFGALNSR